MLQATPQSPTDAVLAQQMQTCHQRIWERLIHPQLGLIYDYVGPDEDARPPFWWLPTAEEIARRYPNPQGWSTGMEDSSLNGGVYLTAMVTAYRLTGETQYAEKARRLYQGLMRTATCSQETGLIVRSLTYDGQHWYPASSVDQYTWWFHGMWVYAHSDIATPQEVAAIKQVVHDVCTRLERDGWQILQEDGKPAYWCNLDAIRIDRSSRLLELLLIAYDLSADPHWLELYQQKLAEQNYARLDSIQDWLAMTGTPYVILQNAASLIPLIALETNDDIRKCYTTSLTACARGMWYAVLACYRYDSEQVASADWDPDWRKRYPPDGFHKGGISFEPPGWQFEDEVVRRPCEAMLVIAYAADHDPMMRIDRVREQFAHTLRYALTTYEYEKLHSYSLIYAETLYWVALDKGLVSRPLAESE